MAELDDRLNKLVSGYYNANLAEIDAESLRTTWNYSGFSKAQHEPWSSFILEQRSISIWMQRAVYYLIHHSVVTPDYTNLYDILGMVGGEDLTWQAIIAAWTANDFEGRAWTIATIDRMRQILWDEPFNVQWAARPEAIPPT